jgi:hypothetical protein
MLIDDCKRELALWCLNNKNKVDAQFTEPLPVIEYLNTLNPACWGPAGEDCDACQYSIPCLLKVCAMFGEKVQAGDFWNRHYGLTPGCVIRDFSCEGFDGQLKGSVITDPTDTKVLSVEAHGE